jgi:hypothetical protein
MSDNLKCGKRSSCDIFASTAFVFIWKDGGKSQKPLVSIADAQAEL